MVLEDLLCYFTFLPVHQISTRPQWSLLVQMTGGQVSAQSYVNKSHDLLLSNHKSQI